MTYIAWSDGSYMEDGKAYIAYVLTDPYGKRITALKAEVKGLNTSYEAEFAALYYLFKKIVELEITQVEINTDCLTLYTNLKKKKKKVARYEEDLVRRLEDKFGKRRIKLLLDTIHWKRREENAAHPLFLEVGSYPVITDFLTEFGKLIRTSKRYRRQNPTEFVLRQKEFLKKQALEKMCWAGSLRIQTVQGEFRLPITNLSIASRILNTRTQAETLKKLEKKIEKAKRIERKETMVLVKGRMEIEVKDKTIIKISVTKRNYADRYKEKGELVYTQFDIERVLRKANRQHEVVEIEGFHYKINKRAYNSLKKKMNEEKIKEFLIRSIENGIVVDHKKVKLIVKGETHLVVQKNTIINLTFSLSNHTKDWMKRQKLG